MMTLTSLLMYGICATMMEPDRLLALRALLVRLTLMVLVLRVLFSMMDRHSATNRYLDGWLFLKQYTWLLAMRSWAISTCRGGTHK